MNATATRRSNPPGLGLHNPAGFETTSWRGFRFGRDLTGRGAIFGVWVYVGIGNAPARAWRWFKIGLNGIAGAWQTVANDRR